MHRLPSKSAVTRFRVAAFLLCLRNLLVPLAPLILAYAMIMRDGLYTRIGVACAALALLVVILQWIAASRCRCPLCLTPPLAKKACAKHRSARPLLGSHRFRVAVTIFMRDYFRCPYCGEPTAMEARQRRHHSHVSSRPGIDRSAR